MLKGYSMKSRNLWYSLCSKEPTRNRSESSIVSEDHNKSGEIGQQSTIQRNNLWELRQNVIHHVDEKQSVSQSWKLGRWWSLGVFGESPWKHSQSLLGMGRVHLAHLHQPFRAIYIIGREKLQNLGIVRMIRHGVGEITFLVIFRLLSCPLRFISCWKIPQKWWPGGFYRHTFWRVFLPHAMNIPWNLPWTISMKRHGKRCGSNPNKRHHCIPGLSCI